MSRKIIYDIDVVCAKKSSDPGKSKIFFRCGCISNVKEMNNAFVVVLNYIIRCYCPLNCPYHEWPERYSSVLDSNLMIPNYTTFQESPRDQMKFLVFGDHICTRNHTDGPPETSLHQKWIDCHYFRMLQQKSYSDKEKNQACFHFPRAHFLDQLTLRWC